MDYQERKDYITQVESEVIRACAKHDRVCDFFVDPNKEMKDVAGNLAELRTINDERERNGGATFSGIIAEELMEAYEAYIAGDLNNCIKELAQVAAVAVRGMDFVYRQTMEFKTKEKYKERI